VPARAGQIVWLVGDRFLIAPEIDATVGRKERLKVDGAHLDVPALIAEIATDDLFSQDRAIIVDDFKPRARELSSGRRRQLIDVLGRLGPGLLLVLATYPEVGGPQGAPNDLEKALSKLGRKVELKAPPEWRERELASWVTSYAHSKGKRISADAAAAMVEQVGADLGALAQELGKVILSIDQSAQQITLGDLDVVSRSAVGLPRLLRAVSARNAAASLAELESLLRADLEPAAIFGALSSSARMIARALMAEKRGASREELAKELGVAPGRAYYLMADARRIREADVGHWLQLLLLFDVASKRGGNPEQLLALLVLGLCAKITTAQFALAASAYWTLD
jgi:DNA polymerase III delta subunit